MFFSEHLVSVVKTDFVPNVSTQIVPQMDGRGIFDDVQSFAQVFWLEIQHEVCPFNWNYFFFGLNGCPIALPSRPQCSIFRRANVLHDSCYDVWSIWCEIRCVKIFHQIAGDTNVHFRKCKLMQIACVFFLSTFRFFRFKSEVAIVCKRRNT